MHIQLSQQLVIINGDDYGQAKRTLIMRHEAESKSNAYWLGLLAHLQASSVRRKVGCRTLNSGIRLFLYTFFSFLFLFILVIRQHFSNASVEVLVMSLSIVLVRVCLCIHMFWAKKGNHLIWVLEGLQVIRILAINLKSGRCQICKNNPRAYITWTSVKIK